MSRKSKYDPATFPIIAEQAARQGARDEEIATVLNIHPSTFYDYQKKYPEFSEAIKRGKIPANLQVEMAAFKRANGYEYEEVREEYETVESKRGRRRRVLVKRVVTKKFMPPDTAAFIYWLNNRDPDNWKSLRHQEIHKEVDSVYDVVKRMADEAREIMDAEILEEDNGDS